jgi:hypothetical protein
MASTSNTTSTTFNIQIIFDAALKDFTKKTGKDLLVLDHPLASKLDNLSRKLEIPSRTKLDDSLSRAKLDNSSRAKLDRSSRAKLDSLSRGNLDGPSRAKLDSPGRGNTDSPSRVKPDSPSDNLDSMLDLFREQAREFDEFKKGDTKLFEWLKPIVNVLYTLCTNKFLGGASSVNPATSLFIIIFATDTLSQGVFTRKGSPLRYPNPSIRALLPLYLRPTPCHIQNC